MSATTPKGISTEAVARMRRAGMTRSAIARSCDCSLKTVHEHLVKAGLSRLGSVAPRYKGQRFFALEPEPEAPTLFRCRCGGVSSRPEGHGHCAPLGLLQGVA